MLVIGTGLILRRRLKITRLIKVIEDGDEVWLNPDHICIMKDQLSMGGNFVRIIMVNGYEVHAKTTVEEVISQIENHQA